MPKTKKHKDNPANANKKHKNKTTAQTSDQIAEEEHKLIAETKQVYPESLSKVRAIKKSIPMDKYIKWYHDEYQKQWKCSAVLSNNSIEIDSTNSSILRMNNITTMKYQFNYNTMDMIVVVFKIYDYYNKKEANYGTLFCEVLDTIKPVRRELYGPGSVYGHIVFTFYSASPSYISCDGEYRARFSLFGSFIKAKEQFYDIWSEIESYVTRIKARRQWSLYPSFYYPKLEQELKTTEVEFAIKHELIPTTLLAITWFHTIYNELVGMTNTHINSYFKDIFLGAELVSDIEFMKELIRKYGGDKIDLFRAKVSHTTKNFQGIDKYMQCGYKMIPLNIKEVQDPLRLRYKSWREYFISNKCNDFVVNSIAPGFAVILDWFYIKNSRKGLYDNTSQYNRMRNSEIARDVVHMLMEAQRGTYFASENLQTIAKTDQQIKQWVNTKFKKLNDKIEDSINYSIEEIIMSEVTLAFVNEYVGRTVADIITLVQNSEVYNASVGFPFQEIGYDYFAKYMFDICYGLYCVNSKLGVIHGDFHLNNATIGALYYPESEIMRNKNKTNKVLYVLDNDTNYIFPNNGYFGCVIDFSRSIINPDTYELLRDTSLPSNYKLVSDDTKFVESEISNLYNLYIQLFPKKIKQKDELFILFKNYFTSVFKLLTCIDLYMFSTRLSRLIAQMNKHIPKKTVSLVDKMFKLSERFITTEMNLLLGNPTEQSLKIASMEYPMLTIIKQCFADYKDGQIYKPIGIITDVYCYHNEMKFSIAKYETFPDILKYIRYADDNGKLVDMTEVAERRKANRTEYEQEKLHNLEMVHYIAARHTAKYM